MKVCNDCKQEKDESEFYHVTKRKKLTIYHLCKECCSSQKKVMKAYYRDWELKKKYGITLAEYNQQCEVRGNVCDICDKERPPLHVDHSHKTGKVRGYLCGSCNRALGLLQDEAQIAFNAATYLKGHNE